jgi:hypothetical protein
VVGIAVDAAAGVAGTVLAALVEAAGLRVADALARDAVISRPAGRAGPAPPATDLVGGAPPTDAGRIAAAVGTGCPVADAVAPDAVLVRGAFVGAVPAVVRIADQVGASSVREVTVWARAADRALTRRTGISAADPAAAGDVARVARTGEACFAAGAARAVVLVTEKHALAVLAAALRAALPVTDARVVDAALARLATRDA